MKKTESGKGIETEYGCKGNCGDWVTVGVLPNPREDYPH